MDKWGVITKVVCIVQQIQLKISIASEKCWTSLHIFRFSKSHWNIEHLMQIYFSEKFEIILLQGDNEKYV